MLRFRRISRLVAAGALLVLGASAWLAAQEPAANAGRHVALLEINGAIGPATADYIRRGIQTSERNNAELIVIEMDTPGGLVDSTRDIIRYILNSTVPVASFVYPQGARAASAGTYILYGSHIAAMAPATNLGAATPVGMGAPGFPADPEQDPADDDEVDGEEPPPTAPGDPMTAAERKAVEDAVAYIRTLAERRDRNADWAERAVRYGESLSSARAVEMDVIDLIASDLSDLLRQLHGRSIELNADRVVTLDTEGLAVERIEPDWRTRLLNVISNPTVAYLLMLIGIYGLIFEGYNPGAIIPGVAGAISLLLALYAFQILPVNYAGLALMALGIILMVTEFMMPSFGALGIGGVAAFVFGSVILMDTDVPGFGVSIPLIVTIATTGSLAMMAIIWFAMSSRSRPIVSGVEQMAHSTAFALEDFTDEGTVMAHGERWRAQTTAPVSKGQKLRITKVEGLLLHVEPVDTR